MIFDVAKILPRYSDCSVYFSTQHTIVPARHYKNLNLSSSQYYNNVIVGRLLSVSTPNNAGFVYGRLVLLSHLYSDGNKKQIVFLLSASSYAILLIFGDYYDPPNCLALTLELRVDFQTTFGTGVQMAQ